MNDRACATCPLQAIALARSLAVADAEVTAAARAILTDPAACTPGMAAQLRAIHHTAGHLLAVITPPPPPQG